jgi:hypothetical protein
MPYTIGLAAVLLCLSGCFQPILARVPSEPLERAIFLREGAADGWHGISHYDTSFASAASVARVIDPATVDAESRIEIIPNLEQFANLTGAESSGVRLRLEAFLERAGKDPIPLHLPGYDVMDQREVRADPQPIEAAPPTRLELERTIAQIGDRITLRSTLLDAGGTPLGQPGEARFRVAQLGWHSSYHPSVVLARPFEQDAADANFRFTPGVAWLHAYTPRHDEDGFWADLMRVTEMNIGPHALLLQFDSETEVEIGLGATIGLWDGVLQLGVGLNLMADDGEGREYFYVGSSLIPLAQAVEQGFNKAW